MPPTLVQDQYVSFVRRPSVSRRVSEIIELVDDPRTSVAKLTSAISKDQSLVSRVLRQANSPFYGFPRRVSDPGFAVILLGFDTLREMVVRTLVAGAFRRMVNSMIRFEEFWNHSIGCGLGSRLLAERTGLYDADDAFVAGLLHDIGYVILNDNGGEDRVKAGNNRIPAGAVSVSTASTRGDHAQVGALLAGRWHLSEEIVEAIRYHHTPALATTSRTLVSIVHTAEALCYDLHIGQPEYEAASTYDPQALGLLGLDQASLTNELPGGYPALLKEYLSHAPSFETLVRDLKRGLVEAIDELSENERVILALLYYEGLSVRDVSKVLGLPESEIEQLQTSSFARLKATIAFTA